MQSDHLLLSGSTSLTFLLGSVLLGVVVSVLLLSGVVRLGLQVLLALLVALSLLLRVLLGRRPLRSLETRQKTYTSGSEEPETTKQIDS